MQKWRLAAIAGVVGATTCAWLAVAEPPPADASMGAPPVRRAAAGPNGVDLPAEIARLHERRQASDPLAVVSTRNLFEFKSRAAAGVAGVPRAQLPPPSAAAVSVQAPPLRLIGIAQDSPLDPSRTAVISGKGGPFLVKEGDTFTLGATQYRAARVMADYVELWAGADPVPFRLVLK